MATAFKLGLPIDIPWTRICVTNDMVDRVVCDDELPPKWQTSTAVFKYTPGDDYQQFPNYIVSYLKVTVTVTGYQALDDEIQGTIDWNGVSVETIEGLTELLNSYHPCHGAIVQVVVGPKSPTDRPLDKYPFFMDFEPKKRELFEMATDTKERQSRSIETLNIGKSAGTTQSLEVLDVDMGGSTSVGAQGSYAGTGGGFNFSTSSQGQWGTKSLNTQQSQQTRTTEVGQEKRESYSHTTQLAQMYHLLDSYHLGTNRAVFFVQPRPHVLEEPSGFVRGPRPVEGIQEFFFVVATPKDFKDYCVSVRVDTSHLAETDILDFETRTDVSELAVANARVPTGNDIPDGTTTRRACFIDCWDVTYNCFRTRDVQDQIYTAPEGFVITGYDDLVNQASHGSTSVSIAPGNKTLTVHAEASGHICFEGSGVCLDCPDEVDKWAGSARRQVQVRLRSELPIRKIGTKQVLLITTRALCCCGDQAPGRVRITGVRDLPDWALGDLTPLRSGTAARLLPPLVQPPGQTWSAMPPANPAATWNAHRSILDNPTWTAMPATVPAPGGPVSPDGATPMIVGHPAALTLGSGKPGDCGCGGTGAPSGWDQPGGRAGLMTARQANSINEFVHKELIKSFREPRPDHRPVPFLQTDLLTNQLGWHLRRSRTGRDTLNTPVEKIFKKDGRESSARMTSTTNNPPSPTTPKWQPIVKAVAARLNKKTEAVTVTDVLRFQNRELVKMADVSLDDVVRVKLTILGVSLKDKDDNRKGK